MCYGEADLNALCYIVKMFTSDNSIVWSFATEGVVAIIYHNYP